MIDQRLVGLFIAAASIIAGGDAQTTACQVRSYPNTFIIESQLRFDSVLVRVFVQFATVLRTLR